MKHPFKFLILHCSATPEGRSVTAQTVRNWHTKPKPIGRGWNRVGYSDLILLDGNRHQFIKHNSDIWIDDNEITNGVVGMNSVSRHICYIGGLTADGKQSKNTLTDAQNATLSSIISEVLSYNPDVLICGHNQFSNKMCPSFWVPEYLEKQCLVKVDQKNIYTNDPYQFKTGLS
jgi:N-acetylmuramoyl-L-alanine amidase